MVAVFVQVPDSGLALVFLVLQLILWGTPLLWVINAARRPSHELHDVDSNTALGIVLPLVSGVIDAIAFLAAIRPRVRAVGR